MKTVVCSVVALQCRKNDSATIKLLDKVNHKLTNICVVAERQFLKVLEGDCETAVGAIANLQNENINLEDSVKSFEAGINLVKECQKQLEDAELKVKELLDDGTSQELDNS